MIDRKRDVKEERGMGNQEHDELDKRDYQKQKVGRCIMENSMPKLL